ncbi:MAG: SMP-30/gluconolactonase/LRE family protein [Bacteroidota bacterium]|nr:SMP-30/gluconolactonase/LRE family protein [Bacteroidota bacterium]
MTTKKITALFVFGFSIVFAQGSMESYSLSLQKYAEKDTAAYLKYAQQAFKLAPTQPDFAANLAKAFAVAGKKKECIEMLDDIAVLGFDYDVEQDSGFINVWKHSLLKNIVGTSKHKAHTVAGTLAFIIREKDLISEGLAYDPRTNIFYISSIYKRKIVALLPDGSANDFTTEAGDGLKGTLGMKVDGARNQLWVLSAVQSPRPKIANANEIGTSIVHQYDLETRRVIRTYTPNDTIHHMFNDLTILATGDVYLTDSEEGAIYKIDRRNNSLQRWYKRETMIYPNGITVSPDQKFLFVAHWAGISRISLADTQEVLLTTKVKTTLVGVDGLYFYRNGLIAVQNSAGPQSRVMRFSLNDKYDVVQSSRILESDNPLYNIPTTGVIVGDEFYFIANSQLASFGSDGKIFPMDKLQPTYILKLKLEE